MGVVYLGRSDDGERVALKVVRPEIGDDPDFRARFGREVDVLRAVSGSCTARLVGADPDGHPAWLATEYIEGPTLTEAIGWDGPLPPLPPAALAVKLAEALVAIHAVGVVHRDLKPGNVLFGAAGPKVIDFGVSALADGSRVTRTGTVVGSPGFMAPEQVRGSPPVGPATDVFAWGLTVAFAGTARQPFGHADRPEVLMDRVAHTDPDVAGLPVEVRAAVTAAIARGPVDRPDGSALLRLLLPGAADPYAAATTLLRTRWPGARICTSRTGPRRGDGCSSASGWGWCWRARSSPG
jgi:serine/threonine protein kinase